MKDYRKCNNYLSEDSPDFIIEYRGNFKEEIGKLDYACGDIITDTLGVVSVPYEYIDRLREDVPSIVYIESRNMYILQATSVKDIDHISGIKNNPYLNLNGRGVIVGMIDSGIDFLNTEFTREDGTSRILSIWDQTAPMNASNTDVYIGDTYTNDEINNAINAYKNGEDPYLIVPTKDEANHGTSMAGIIGGRGYIEQVGGVASDCDFVIVKLFESLNYRRMLRENGIPYVPVYNEAEVLAAVEYLRAYSEKFKRPMVIYLGVGSTNGSHAGNNIFSTYLSITARERGIALVAGVGNEGASEGHVSGIISTVGEIQSHELFISKIMKELFFEVWVRRPDILSINIVTPYGEMSGFIDAKIQRVGTIRFVLTNSAVEVMYNIPEAYTGDQRIILRFKDIKPGIWKLEVRGEYVANGRYDIWLPPRVLLPEGTKFLVADPFVTLSIPSTARRIVTVAYYNSETGALVSESGNGFNSNDLINPDVTTAGINVLATSNGGAIKTVSGSSVATAIVSGVCALILQWGIVDNHDTTMYSTKIRSYLIYGADRNRMDKYPNKYTGYGFLNTLKTFNVIGGIYRTCNREEFNEYYVGNLYIKIPN